MPCSRYARITGTAIASCVATRDWIAFAAASRGSSPGRSAYQRYMAGGLAEVEAVSKERWWKAVMEQSRAAFKERREKQEKVITHGRAAFIRSLDPELSKEQTWNERELGKEWKKDNYFEARRIEQAAEAALGKASGAPITADDMETVTAQNAGISDLTGLESAANLTELHLGWNNISELSILAGLTNLTFLNLENNGIRDISPLSGLTNLTELWLFENNIADVSPLAGLTNLTDLRLGINDLTDVSALGGLVRLSNLELEFNRVTDISALAGLTGLTRLELQGNPLSDSSINDHIPPIERRGASVFFDSFRKGDYDIELVFSDHFTEPQKNVLRYVARRWMAVISEDLPDYEFIQGWSGSCGDQSHEIPAGERIDDLRIYMGTFEGGNALGYGSPSVLRQETHLPVLGCMGFDLTSANLLITGLHEIGHVLGFGPLWDELGFLQDRDGDTHFNGPLAIAAFDEAGGSDYTGAKVPVQKRAGNHWRSSAFPDELMTPGGGSSLSAITVQSLADLGYGVDITQADAYTLPGAAAAQARGNTTAAIPEDDRLRGNLASPTHAEPKLWCGLDGEREPIYVVDQQGRVIRTIGN